MPRFIPRSDFGFAEMARTFVNVIQRDPRKYHIETDAIQHALALVQRFRDALAVHLRPSTSTRITRVIKSGARRDAEAAIRSLGRMIRAHPTISDADKLRVGIEERHVKLQRRVLPMMPPCVRFVGSSKDPRKHVLLCTSQFMTRQRRKPFGAVRVELFVEFLKPGSPLQGAPAMMPGIAGVPGNGRLWYLRSFTTSRIEVDYPLPAEPMVIVYWARWADQTGETGAWSKPAVARIEYAAPAMTGMHGIALPAADHRKLLCTDAVVDEASAEYPHGVYVVPPRELPAGAAVEPKHDARYMLTARELRECYVERE
jgi:hypothetical protein